jgi:hypothetical protein
MTGFRVSFAMASDVRYLPVVRGAMGALTAVIGWDEAECRAIVLALDEAIANVIRHAYRGGSDGLIELECRESADGLEVSMLDRGEPPDLSRICAREVGFWRPSGCGKKHEDFDSRRGNRQDRGSGRRRRPGQFRRSSPDAFLGPA